MDQATKKAADRVNQHREDGEEAIQRTSNVVPIDSGRNRETVQVTPDAKPENEEMKAKKKKTARGQSK